MARLVLAGLTDSFLGKSGKSVSRYFVFFRFGDAGGILLR